MGCSSLDLLRRCSTLDFQGKASLRGESLYVIMFYVNNEIKERDCPIGDHALLNYILRNNSSFDTSSDGIIPLFDTFSDGIIPVFGTPFFGIIPFFELEMKEKNLNTCVIG